jgi:hypothetical protein
MGDVKTYDFKSVAVIFGGRLLTGFAEGDAVTVEHDEDMYTTTNGADGEVTRSRSNNNMGTITLRFMQTADANDILNGFVQADLNSNSGIQPILIKDNSGRSLHAAEKAWIQKQPAAGYGAEASEREWVIRCGQLVSTFGGNG